MKFKHLGALFLLSLASIYFICPVQCAVIQEPGEYSRSDKLPGHHQHRIGSQTVDETNQPTCCQTENQSTPSQEQHTKEEGHCCFIQWESFGASEPQLPSQIQKDTLSVVVLTPATPSISSISASFTAHLQLSYNPYTDPPISQFSPRAPPFSLA